MTKCEALDDAVNAGGAAEQVFPDGEGGFSDQDLVSLRPPASSFFPAPRPLKHRPVRVAGLRFLV